MGHSESPHADLSCSHKQRRSARSRQSLYQILVVTTRTEQNSRSCRERQDHIKRVPRGSHVGDRVQACSMVRQRGVGKDGMCPTAANVSTALVLSHLFACCRPDSDGVVIYRFNQPLTRWLSMSQRWRHGVGWTWHTPTTTQQAYTPVCNHTQLSFIHSGVECRPQTQVPNAEMLVVDGM